MTDVDNTVNELFVVDKSMAQPFTTAPRDRLNKKEVFGQFAFMLEKSDGGNTVMPFKANDLTGARKSANRRLESSKQTTGRLLQLEGILKDGRKVYRSRSVLQKDGLTKGFINGTAEVGLHAHGLNRRQETTFQDGAHTHLFLLPDGSTVITQEDGQHLHTLDQSGSDVSNSESAGHQHRVNLPSGEIVFTEEGGEHEHELMLETTGFDGGHVHTLILPNGDRLRSMSIADYWSEFGPFPSAEELPGSNWFTRTVATVKAEEDGPVYLDHDIDVSKELTVDMDESVALALEALGITVEKQSDEDEKKKKKKSNKRKYRTKEFNIRKIHEDQQIVYGVILEEGEVNGDGLFTDDLAGDFVLAQDVEKAAFRYMEKGELIIKKGHSEEIPVTLVENLVVRPGDIYNGVKFNKTAWIAGVHIPSSELWEKIKSGEFNSFSVGGFGLRKEI